MHSQLLIGSLVLAASCDSTRTTAPEATPPSDAPASDSAGRDAPSSIWHVRESGTTANLLGAAFGSEFVAVGAGGTVVTSSDGRAWQVSSVGTSNDLLGLTFASISLHRYIAVGPGVVFTSSTGTSWRGETLNGTGGTMFQAVIQNHPSIVGVGTGGALVTSPNGDVWTLRSTGAPGVLLLGAANGNTRDVGLVAVGETTSGVILTASDPTDGSAWTMRASGLALLHAVTAPVSGPRLIAVGAAGSIYTSDDGIAWTPHPVGDPAITFNAVTQCRDYLAVGQIGNGTNPQGVVASSSDGFSWSIERLSVGSLNAIACGATDTVLVGSGGTIVSTQLAPPR